MSPVTKFQSEKQSDSVKNGQSGSAWQWHSPHWRSRDGTAAIVNGIHEQSSGRTTLSIFDTFKSFRALKFYVVNIVKFTGAFSITRIYFTAQKIYGLCQLVAFAI